MKASASLWRELYSMLTTDREKIELTYMDWWVLNGAGGQSCKGYGGSICTSMNTSFSCHFLSCRGPLSWDARHCAWMATENSSWNDSVRETIRRTSRWSTFLYASLSASIFSKGSRTHSRLRLGTWHAHCALADVRWRAVPVECLRDISI